MRFLFWKAPVSKYVRISDDPQVNGRELFFYGITIGWVGFGFIVGAERQPTKRAADGLKRGAKNTSPSPRRR